MINEQEGVLPDDPDKPAKDEPGVNGRPYPNNTHFAQLATALPHGVIINDLTGKIVFCNEQVRQLLGYRVEELYGRDVSAIFVNPQQARQLGDRLRKSRNGHLPPFDCTVLHRDKKPIPIRLSVTWAYNNEGQREGIIGYFEDLSQLQTAKHQLNLLQSASDLLNRADNLEEGLQALAELMVDFWGVSFCRILLYDPEEKRLSVTAAYPFAELDTALQWQPGVGEIVAKFPETSIFPQLQDETIKIFHAGEPAEQRFLQDWFQPLQMEPGTHSLLAASLQTADRTIGIMELGETRPWSEVSFSDEMCDLVKAIARQTAVIVDRIQLYNRISRREHLLVSLDETSRHIRAIKERQKLLREVIRLAAELAGCTLGGLYINQPHTGELLLIDVHGLPRHLIGNILKYGDGLIGQVAVTKETVCTNDYRNWPQREAVLIPYQLETLVGIPLKLENGDLEAVLFVADKEKVHRLTSLDIDILQRFAQQAAVALHTSQLLNREQRVYDKLSLLHRISNYIQSTSDLDKILHVVLTGVTAGYGLCFNRAAILLLDETGEYLTGQMAIGHYEIEAAKKDWEQYHRDGLSNFNLYLQYLADGALSKTPIEENIRDLKIRISPLARDSFSRSMTHKISVTLLEYDLNQLPDSFTAVFQPDWPVVIVPLLAQDAAIGVLVVDNKFTHDVITNEDMELLLMFANTAAAGINKERLLAQTKKAHQRLHTFYEASNALVMPDDPRKVGEIITSQAREVTHAAKVRMLLIDKEVGLAQDALSPKNQNGSYRLIRPDGLTNQILETGRPEIKSLANFDANDTGMTFLNHGYETAVGLPIAIDGKRVGVMWFYYEQTRQFPQVELEALQLFVNQAAIVYENAHRMQEMTQLQKAAEALSGAADISDVLQRIAESARAVLGADWVSVLSYDETRYAFDLNNSAASGIHPALWHKQQKKAPRRGGTAETVMNLEWVGVRDIAGDDDYPFLGNWTLRLMQETGSKSFQGVALTVGEQRLGVLFANYKQPHTFTENDQKLARTFANHAALALRNVRLMTSLKQAFQSARIVAKVSTLNDLKQTLEEISAGMGHLLNCGAVTVHVYDEYKNKLISPPTTYGMHYPERLVPDVQNNALIKRVLNMADPIHIVPDVSRDSLYSQSRFSRDEKIASLAVIRLHFGRQVVGIIHVNYREPHNFTKSEIEQMRLFADQTAVVIHNALIYERERRRNAALQALHGAGVLVTSSLDRDAILQQIAEQSCSLLTSPGRQISYSSIWLIEEPDKAKLVATFPSDEYTRTVNVIGDTIERKSENGRTGIVWRAINSGQPQLVQNVKDDPDYIQSQADTLSELAVPIIFKEEIIGVINVEHSVIDAFDSLDILALEALANQAAVAIETANLYRKALHHTRLLDATAAVARFANSILDEELLLDEIVHVIAEKLDFHHVAVYLLDKQKKRLTMRSASSEAGKQMVLNEHHLQLGKGIVGKVALTGQYHLTSDIRLDENHLANTLLPQTLGEMAFPLIIRGELIGVLDIQKNTVIDLSEENTAALRTMAKQLSNAIQNARLFEKTQANADTLGALYRAGIAVTSSLDLENILQEIVTQAWSLTGTRGENARFCCLVMKAGEALDFMAAYPPETLDHLRKTVGQISLAAPKKFGIIGRAFKTGQAQRVDDVANDDNYLLYDPETRSELAVPIRVGDKTIGVINVEHPEIGVFDPQDEKALISLAALAATAIQNAETYREVTLLQKAAKALAGELEQIGIVRETLLTAVQLVPQTESSFLFWDEEQRLFEPAYTKTFAKGIHRYKTTARQDGATRRVIQTKKPVLLLDTLEADNVNPTMLRKKRRSICGVPVLCDGQVLAVLHVYGREPDQFSDHQITLLKALASIAGVALAKAHQYEELKKTKGMVGSRTALAWMGMASNAWRHSIEGDATNIRNAIELIQPSLTGIKNDQLRQKIENKLQTVHSLARRILARPITPPLSSEEGVEYIPINDLLQERIRQLWEDDAYVMIQKTLILEATKETTVWASSDWLRRAIDMVVDNARDAMLQSATKQLEIKTAVHNETIEIAIKDTGCGIPKEKLNILFTGSPEQAKREGHLGRGLLMVQAIMETYGGEVFVQETNKNGTTMVLSLPIARGIPA